MEKIRKNSTALLALAAICGVLSLSIIVGILPVSVQADVLENMSIGNYTVIATTRVGLTAYDYEVKASVTNNGAAATNVNAVLVGYPTGVTPIDSTLSFGAVAAGETVVSNDTFTIRIDRSQVFDETQLVFEITGDLEAEPPVGMFSWVNAWPGQAQPMVDPIYAITARHFPSDNDVIKVDFSTFNSESYLQNYFRADVPQTGSPVITARDMRFVDNPTTGAVAPVDGAWNQGAFSNDALLSSIRTADANYGTVSALLEFDFATFAMDWDHRIAKWGSDGIVTAYQTIGGTDRTNNTAGLKFIAGADGTLLLGYTTVDGHALVQAVDPDTLALGAVLIDLPETMFGDIIFDDAANYIAVGRSSGVGAAFGKKGGVAFFYEITEIPGMSSFVMDYIIRDQADGNLIVVGTGIRSDDSRNHGFVAKTTSPTFIDFVWPPAEIDESWTIQFSPDNPASQDTNWAPYNVPDNAFVFYGWDDPRIFVDRNIPGYIFVPTNSASPDFSVLSDGEWANWVLDLSSLGYGIFYYVVIVPADNSPVPVVSATIVRPAGSWMVGDPISFTVRLRNSDDFILSAASGLGCVKDGTIVTCTPTAVGTYGIGIAAADDPSVTDSMTVTVVERVALSISPAAINLEIGEPYTFTVTKENTDDFILEDLPGMGCEKIDNETVTCTPTFWVAGRTRDVVVMAPAYRSKTAAASITVAALDDAPENFSITRTSGTTSATFNMIYVEGGTYTRGRNAREDDDERGLPPPDQYETPAHEVTLSSYWIMDREITGAMQRVMGDNTGSGTTPLSNINWYDANRLACQLSNLTSRPFRLLSDAEWEFAARGGNVGKDDDFIYAGSNTASDVATYSGRGSLSAPPGTGASARLPNQLGIYDMSGNAFEWVYDWIESYTSSPKVDPVETFGMGNKTRRGGSTDEPAIYARVSRRAIRSREGGAGMGFRLGYGSLPPGMQTPCDAADSGYSLTANTGGEFRDDRLIVSYDQAWVSSTAGTNAVIIRGDGAGSVGSQRGSWFTVNDRVLYIVTENGVMTSYPYFLFNMNEMTVITDPNGGLPTRYYRVPTYLVTNDIVEPVAIDSSLEEMVALVPAENILTREQLENPDTTIRDPRLILGPDELGRERRWFFDGNCCGGNHKYRFELRADGTAEFVVMDYNNGGTNGLTFDENVLATTNRANATTKGYWFTTGNVALHLYFQEGSGQNRYNNYLYTVGERTSGSSLSHSPPTPVHTHVSMQDYERGDFRIFNGIIRRFETEARTPLQEKEVAGTSTTATCYVGTTSGRCAGLVSPGSGIYNYTFQDPDWPLGYIVRPYSGMSNNGNPVYTPVPYKWRSGQ